MTSAPNIGGPYPCYRCRKRHPEWSFVPFDRCGFPKPDTRGSWTRFIDWLKGLWG
jgi:hypothetical protein